MILVGQYDSPFVRRVAVTLNLYGFPFVRRPFSVFKDFDAVLALNPLGKVPVLTLDDGENLFDSRAILDYLDSLVEPGFRLLPPAEPERHRVLRVEVIAVGLCEKLYELGYEFARREAGKQDSGVVARTERQVRSALDWLEVLRPSPWLQGANLNHPNEGSGDGQAGDIPRREGPPTIPMRGQETGSRRLIVMPGFCQPSP
jgi:glutathione S-transferase